MITIGILWDAPPQEICAFSSIHTFPILDSVSKQCAWSAGSDNRQAARPDTNSGIWRYEGSYQLSKFRYDNWRIDCNVVSHKTDSHLCNILLALPRMSKQIEFAGSVLEFWCGKTRFACPTGQPNPRFDAQRRFHFFWCIPKMCHRVFQPLAKGEGQRVDRRLDGKTKQMQRNYAKLRETPQ